MPKQLLIYENAVPVNAARHANASVEVGTGYVFSAALNAVPLMAVEFLRAASEYAIVFATNVDEAFMPIVVLGIRGGENLYLGADGGWRAHYVPAFLRRYPFVFSSSPDPGKLTLCIDESAAGFNRTGRGEPLFVQGRPSPYVEQVLRFLKEYQGHFARTEAFGRKLRRLGLLEPMRAQVQTPGGERLSMKGFFAAQRSRLRGLAADDLASLTATDELELLYLHLHSLRNFGEMKDRLFESLAAEAGPAQEQPAPMQ